MASPAGSAARAAASFGATTSRILPSVSAHRPSMPRYFSPWQLRQACSLGRNVCPTSPAVASDSFGTMWHATHSTRTWNMWLGIIGVPRPPMPRYMRKTP